MLNQSSAGFMYISGIQFFLSKHLLAFDGVSGPVSVVKGQMHHQNDLGSK